MNVNRTVWSHLNLTGWPFQTVPDKTFVNVWADRARVKEQVDRLIWRLSRVDKSTLHFMWADLGAGKTHTLKYIHQYFLIHKELNVLPVYSVMPKQMHSFLDVYQAIMSGLDIDSLVDTFNHIYRTAGGRKILIDEVFPYIPDACTVLRTIQPDSKIDRFIAIDWLKASKNLTRRQLDILKVNKQIRSTDDAVAIFSGFIKLIQIQQKYQRVLVMLDECQRIGMFKLSIGRDINTGLQTWYDSNPNNLTLLLSFGSGEEEYVRHLLSPELQSREDHTRISMPLLSKEEAIIFIKDLLTHFQADKSLTIWFPFTQELVENVIENLTKKGAVTPRVLMKVFDALLSEADFRIGKGQEFILDRNQAFILMEEALNGPQSDGSEH